MVLFSRYSPHLEPIEPCFSLVKKYVRRENKVINDLECIALIDGAFENYQVGNPNVQKV